MTSDDWNRIPGPSTDFTCPDCSGALRVIEDDEVPRYRCRVGHSYGLDGLVAAKDEAVEVALWVALQTLQERAQMLESMADDDRRHGRTRSATDLDGRARETREHADRLHEFVLRLAR